MLNLIEISFIGTIFILSIIFFRAIMKKYLSQRVFMLLWYLAIVRLMLPISFIWEAKYQSALSKTNQATSELANQIWQGTIKLIDSSSATEYSGSPSNLLLYFSLKLLWIFGMIVILIYFLWSYRSCQRNFRESLPIQDKNILCMLYEISLTKHQMRFRHIHIRSFDKISSPLTYGIFHPVILLPKKLLANLEKKEAAEATKTIITHEFIHIKRMDTLTKILLVAVLAIHWFNPFVWLMYFLANRDIELVCDEMVMYRLGENRRSFYASLLLHMEAERSPVLSIYNHFSKNILEERITEIMKGKKITITSSICATLFILGAVFTIFTKNAKAENPSNETITSTYTETIETEISTTPKEEKTEPTFITSDEAENSKNEKLTENPSYIWVSGEYHTITSTFGERVHPVTGQKTVNDHITIMGESGAGILAAADGKVEEIGFETQNGWGNYILLNHGDGLCTMYTHCKEISVKIGDTIKQGDTIATMGKTGNATGVCLGFYVYKDGVAQNPENYLPLIEN